MLHVYDNNDLYSFEGMTQYIGGILCHNTILYNVWRLFEDVGRPVLILNRLNEFLDMIGKPTVEKVEGYINI